MAKGITLGYLPCPWCRELHGREALATLRENAKNNVFVVCEGGPDGSQVSCGQGCNLHSRNSARVKAMVAKLERDAPEAGNTIEPAANPEPMESDNEHGRPDPEQATDDQPAKRRGGFSLL